VKATAALIDTALERGVFPGAQLLVIDAGSVVLDLAVGLRSLGGPPVTATTLFDVASLTKALVTTLLTLRLVERGALAWDAPAQLPGVTVRHLLTHSSGLPAWRPLFQTARGRDAIVAAAAAQGLERPPGSASVYSDLGFILLGQLVEDVAGARLDALAQRELFPAVGAARARYVDLALADRPVDVAATEGFPPGEVHDENCHAAGGVLGHAGLFATSADVAALATAVIASWHGDGGAVFPSALVRTLFGASSVPGSTWCLGWDRPAAHGSSAGERWPKDGVGHLGYTGCSLWLDLPRRRAVVLLTNRVHPSRENQQIKAFRPLLHDTIVGELDGPPG
jgi:CubicO group peptidase (beta-lactamase class C family)